MFPLRDTIPSRSFPIVTLFLIITNSIVFIYELLLGPALDQFLNTFGVIPVFYTQALQENPLQVITGIIPIFSSIFLHGGWIHVISNMWFLWIFGDNVEDRTGHFRFLLFYLLCGFLATLAHIIANPLSSVPTIGASGAIAGVMGAYIILYPRAKIVTLIFLFIFIQIIEIPAFFFLGFWVILQIISGTLSTGLTQESGGVAWWAHIGGFFVGFLLIFIFKKTKSKSFI
jgi:membrane associated rhomboid family serine protease